MILQLKGRHQTTVEYDGKIKKIVFKQIHHIDFICMEFQNVPLGTLLPYYANGTTISQNTSRAILENLL